MSNGKLIMEDIYGEICHRYGIENYEEAQHLFFEALKDQNIQEKIYDRVHELVLHR